MLSKKMPPRPPADMISRLLGALVCCMGAKRSVIYSSYFRPISTKTICTGTAYSSANLRVGGVESGLELMVIRFCAKHPHT